MAAHSRPKPHTFYSWLLALNAVGEGRARTSPPVDFKSYASMDYWRPAFDAGFTPTEALDQEADETSK